MRARIEEAHALTGDVPVFFSGVEAKAGAGVPAPCALALSAQRAVL